MGQHVDFFDPEGAAKPDLVERLRHLELDDPELLARLIDGHAGIDLDARSVGLEEHRRKLRAELQPVMKKLQQLATEIVGKVHDDRWVDPSELAMADLLQGPRWRDLTQTHRYLDDLERLARTSVRPDRTEFGGKPELDRATTRVVSAVADYCGRKRLSFSEPRVEQTTDGTTYPIKSEGAKLADAVLKALGMAVEPKTLATHMKKGRLAANLHRKSGAT